MGGILMKTEFELQATYSQLTELRNQYNQLLSRLQRKPRCFWNEENAEKYHRMRHWMEEMNPNIPLLGWVLEKDLFIPDDQVTLDEAIKRFDNSVKSVEEMLA